MPDQVIKRVETPIGEMTLLAGGVLVHRLDDSVLVTPDSVEKVMEVTAELAGGQPVAVVVDMRRIAFADHQTRDSYASFDASGSEVATALLVGPRVATFLASRWVNESQPARATRMFEDEVEAVEWARQQVAAHS
jgi:hypothetical protein